MSKLIDLTGQKFGRLVVLRKAATSRMTRWVCECECGLEITAVGENLKSGNTRSCGCLKREDMSARFTSHGGRGTLLYRQWQGMKDRCYNRNAEKYPQYGGRGIKVEPTWLNSFAAFREYALANGYERGLIIDREDFNGDYVPGNVRWVDDMTSGANKRGTIWVEENGAKVSLAAAIRARGLSAKQLAIYKRIHRGWSIDRALNTPFREGVTA